MITVVDNEEIIIGSRADGWEAIHRRNRISGPALLRIDGTSILEDLHCRIGEHSDLATSVESCRSWRKAGIDNLVTAGYLPGEPAIRVTNTFRYGAGFVKIHTELKIPPGVVVYDSIAVAAVTLPGCWDEFRQIIQPETMTADRPSWMALQTDTNGTGANLPAEPMMPLSTLFRRRQDLLLEIGIGPDLWRWQQGFGNGAENFRSHVITNSEGVHIERATPISDRGFTPEARIYSFSSYIAWAVDADGPPVPPYTMIAPIWNGKGELDAGRTSDICRSGGANAALELDIAAMRWPHNTRRLGNGESQPGTEPCFMANGTVNRLKRMIRQIVGMGLDDLPIVFRGLHPGACTCGSHLSRSGAVMHWDLFRIIDFAMWARRALGPERSIHHDHQSCGIPSLRNLFAIPHESEEQYEWIG